MWCDSQVCSPLQELEEQLAEQKKVLQSVAELGKELMTPNGARYAHLLRDANTARPVCNHPSPVLYSGQCHPNTTIS